MGSLLQSHLHQQVFYLNLPLAAPEVHYLQFSQLQCPTQDLFQRALPSFHLHCIVQPISRLLRRQHGGWSECSPLHLLLNRNPFLFVEIHDLAVLVFLVVDYLEVGVPGKNVEKIHRCRGLLDC